MVYIYYCCQGLTNVSITDRHTPKEQTFLVYGNANTKKINI
jgi:hypothetical protein